MYMKYFFGREFIFIPFMGLWVECLMPTGENSVNGYDPITLPCNGPPTTIPNKLIFYLV